MADSMIGLEFGPCGKAGHEITSPMIVSRERTLRHPRFAQLDWAAHHQPPPEHREREMTRVPRMDARSVS